MNTQSACRSSALLTGRSGERRQTVVNPFEPPRGMCYETDGILYELQMIGKVVKGNCCAVIAVEFEG